MPTNLKSGKSKYTLIRIFPLLINPFADSNFFFKKSKKGRKNQEKFRKERCWGGGIFTGYSGFSHFFWLFSIFLIFKKLFSKFLPNFFHPILIFPSR